MGTHPRRHVIAFATPDNKEGCRKVDDCNTMKINHCKCKLGCLVSLEVELKNSWGTRWKKLGL
ncbi:hypothetical protein GYH30_025892 [Glycine max]|nr:hypothetical protein GYH30_025892 [Glycine max]